MPRPSRWSNALYLALSGAFIVLSLLLLGAAFWQAVRAVLEGGAPVDALLDAVGLVVIAIVTADVGNYLFEEEIERDRELRSPVEARRSLTKFMVIICIAVALEGVVQISRATHGPPHAIYGAVLLIMTAVAVMIGLGIYQRLSRTVEKAESGPPPE